MTFLDWLTSGISNDLLQHLYGVSNGLYIASIAYLLFAALSYMGKSNTQGISRAYLLTCISLGFFAFYGLFFQYYGQTVSTHVLPAKGYYIAKYSTPLALAIITYVYLKYSSIMSYQAYELGQKYRGVIIALYAFDLILLIALYFMDDMKSIATLITLAIVPHMLAATIHSHYAMQNTSLKRFLSFLFLACTLHSLLLAWLIFTQRFSTAGYIIAAISIIFACTNLTFSFVVVRYGYDEAKIYFQRQEVDHHNLIHGVHKALKNNDFYLVYQPQINLHKNTLFGLEGLIRWKHPQQGIILPEDFIPLAEKADLIDGVCRWVIQSAVQECRKLMDKGFHLRISINFSAKNVTPDMVRFLDQTLQKNCVSAQYIGVEITESLMLQQSPESQEALDMLHALQVPISLDDYGTGFSSLSSVNKLCLNEIKIDRTFVTDIDSNNDNYVISNSTILMGRTLGLQVVAEGVETELVLNQLKTMGCDIAQGHHIAHPMPVDKLYEWLKTSKYTQNLQTK